jgi:MFS family permease
MSEKPKQKMRTFYTIWFGQLISTLGSGLTGFALGIWVYQNTQSVTLFAINVVAYMVPSVLLSPIAGALADRWNRRWVMVLADTGAGLSTLAIWLLFATGQIEVWHVYVVSFFNAAFTTFQWPAYSAATTMLVPKEHLGRAGGMVQIGEAISQLVSPAISGAVLLNFGISGVVMIDFATYVFAILALLVVFIPEPERTEEGKEGKGSLFQEVVFGWKYIVVRKGLLYLLLYFAALNFTSGIFGALLTPMMLELGNEQQVGIVSSVIGVGMLIGTLVMSAWGGPKRRVYGVLGSGLWMGIFVLGLGAQPSLTLIAFTGFMLLAALPVMNGSSQALWQTKTAPDVQGRVFSVRRMIAQFTAPISAILVGPLVDEVFQPMMDEGGLLASSLGRIIGVGPGRGTALVFIVIGSIIILATLAAFANPRLRLVEDEIPDAEVRERIEDSGTTEVVPATAD